MCGICGFLMHTPERLPEGTLRRMTDSIAHRGPDADGFWEDPSAGIGLGHRRLAILELSPLGAQPRASLSPIA